MVRSWSTEIAIPIYLLGYFEIWVRKSCSVCTSPETRLHKSIQNLFPKSKINNFFWMVKEKQIKIIIWQAADTITARALKPRLKENLVLADFYIRDYLNICITVELKLEILQDSLAKFYQITLLKTLNINY
jgi:hypothetical protein